MARLQIDSLFAESAGVCRLSDRAFRIHLDALLYMKHHGLGVLSAPQALRIRIRNKGRRSHLEELVAGRLWIPMEDGGFTLPPRHRSKQASRRWISPALRRQVFERDEWVCVICADTENLTLDHVIPFSYGGPDTIDNLRTMCASCNSRRGAARMSDEVLRGR